jgi:hypothetical protein
LKIIKLSVNGIRVIAHNGLAIKGVCIDKRMEAGAVKWDLERALVPARAERLKIALWIILAKEPVCRVERSMPCPDLSGCKNRDNCASRSHGEGWAYNLYYPCYG